MRADRTSSPDWAIACLEFGPLAAFSWAGRFGVEILHRFWLGAALALCVTLFLRARRYRPNPLLVAANVWLGLEALALSSGIGSLTRLSATMQEAAFFATMLATGVFYLVLSRHGLFPRPGTTRQVRQGSIALMALIAAGLVWSLFWRGNELVAAVLPATIIFVLQQAWPMSSDRDVQRDGGRNGPDR